MVQNMDSKKCFLNAEISYAIGQNQDKSKIWYLEFEKKSALFFALLCFLEWNLTKIFSFFFKTHSVNVIFGEEQKIFTVDTELNINDLRKQLGFIDEENFILSHDNRVLNSDYRVTELGEDAIITVKVIRIIIMS